MRILRFLRLTFAILLLVVAFFLSWLKAEPAEAGPVTLLWEAPAEALQTEIEMMVCTGGPRVWKCVDWVVALTVDNAKACNAAHQCTAALTAPAGFIHFAFRSVSARGTALRRDVGVWHNQAWAVTNPTGAANVGAQ